MAANTKCPSPRRFVRRSILMERGSSSTFRRGSMRIDFVTIFPRMFDPFLAEGVIARGVKQGALDIRVGDLRAFAADRHRSTDDEAYGGGPGMVMLAEPVLRCVEKIRGPRTGDRGPRLLMTSPQGRKFDQ